MVISSKEKNLAKNIKVIPPDEEVFAKYLARCNGFLCHGGISAISEAIFLKKPIYSVADSSFFERYYNARLVMQNGLGYLEEAPTVSGLKHFFSKLAEYEKNLSDFGYSPQNKELAEEVSKLVESFKASYKKKKFSLFNLKGVKEGKKANFP